MAPVAAALEAEDRGEGPSVPSKQQAPLQPAANADAMKHSGRTVEDLEAHGDTGGTQAPGSHPVDGVAQSSSKSNNNEEAWAALASMPKRRWAPTRYRTEPPHPPVIDHRLEEEAAAHQAAQEAGYEGRRVRKFLQRRTVDYNGSFARWRLQRNLITCARQDHTLRPGVNHVVELLPSAAYRSSAQAVTTNLVHSSTNKIRCPVNVIRWTPEGRRLLTGSSSGEYTLWNGLTFNFETILQAHDHAIRAIDYTKSGAWIVSGDQGGIIKYFQSNMNNLQMINAHREAVRDLSFSPDDSRFVTASDDSTMKLWSFEEAREESTLTGHGWDVKAVDWHPYKGLLVSGSKDNLVKFWDPRTGTTLATYHGHKGTVQAVKWSNDGNLVATASRDQVLKLYDIRAMAELHTLKGHPNDVCSVDWHPDHRDLLVSGGSEGSVMFWSLNAGDPGMPVHSMPTAHDSNVWSLQWHPLGHILASGSNDHTTRFWERARPEDGRLAREGHETDAQQASKQQRWNKAVRGGGEEWDDESSFIPGLGSTAKRQAGGGTVPSPGSAPSSNQDAFLPPGLGGAGARPPPAPPSAPMTGANTFDALPGLGRPPPTKPGFGATVQDDGYDGRNGFGSSMGTVPLPREPQGFVPLPRERQGFVPPPREGGGGGGGGGYGQITAVNAGGPRGGLVPPPRDSGVSSMGGGGFVPPPREGGGPGSAGRFAPAGPGAGGFTPGGGMAQGMPGSQGGFVPPPREAFAAGSPPNGPASMGRGMQPPSGPRGGGRGGFQHYGGGRGGGFHR